MIRRSLPLFAGAALALASGSAMAADVTVTLTGVQARGGELLVALQTRDQFLQHHGAHGQEIADPPAGTQILTFHDVAAGDYSVSALHDVDGDHRMTLNAGRPAEGWGLFHGEALRAAPTFDQVKFSVPASGAMTVTVAMDYPPRS